MEYLKNQSDECIYYRNNVFPFVVNRFYKNTINIF